jgi:hypothetical protein
MQRPEDDGAHVDSTPALEGELIEPASTLPDTRQPPGRKPVAPIYAIAQLSGDELTASPEEMVRARARDYINWLHACASMSPSKLQRVSFGAEIARRAVDKLITLAVSPARQIVEPLGEHHRASTDAELLAILESLGPDLRLALREAPESEQREGLPVRGSEEER